MAWEDDVKRNFNAVKAASTPGAALPVEGYFSSFARSAVESIPELIGISPSERTLNWRAQNPISGFASEMAGSSIPYAGWFGVTKLPAITKRLELLNDAAKPIRSGILRESARWLPFEGARVAGAATFGDPGSVLGTAGSAALDLGLFAGLGAAGGAIKAFGFDEVKEGFTSQIQKVIPEFDAAGSRQERLRALAANREKLALDPGLAATADEYIQTLQRAVRAESLTSAAKGQGAKYVRPLEEGDSRPIGRLFDVRPDIEIKSPQGVPSRRGLVSKRFIAANGEFDDINAWKGEAARLGLPENFEDAGQFFRKISFNKDESAAEIEKTIQKNLKPITDNWYMAKEANEGLYVLARKFPAGPKASKADEWLMFKTDQPGRFIQTADTFSDLVKRRSWDPAEALLEEAQQRKLGLHLHDFADQVQKALPFQGFRGIPATKFQATLEKSIENMGLRPATDVAVNTYKKLREAGKRYFAPAVHQFANSPAARYAFGVSRMIFDEADGIARKVAFGEQQTGRGGSLFREVVASPKVQGGLKGMIDEFDEQDLYDVWRAWQGGLTPDKFAAENLTQKAQAFLKTLDEFDDWQIKQVQGSERMVGSKESIPRKAHYMISRTWEGDWRVPLLDETGRRTVVMASGRTKGQVQKRADEIIEEAATRGIKLQKRTDNPAFLSDRESDVALARSIQIPGRSSALAREAENFVTAKARRPKFFEERQGIGGYVGEKAPWDKKELFDMLWNHIQRTQRYVAENAVNFKMKPYFASLSETEPKVLEQLKQRIDDMAVKQGPVAKTINRMTDKVLAPMLGSNSATKVASATNGLLFHWNLGMGNIVHPINNALSFIQTTLPHVAFILSASPERAARYYTHFPIANERGVVGNVGVWDMWKMLQQSFREMGKPSDELRSMYERAAREGVVDPRMVEEYLGENSQQVQNFRQIWSKPEGATNFIKAASSFLPAITEKFSRGHSFVVGQIVGRDALGLKGDALYYFAKEFTGNTMYGYATADRPRFITGPLGSTFGLFKNWSMHYLGSLMLYTNEAAVRGNWGPLLWSMAGTGSLAGIGGMPLYALADGVSRIASDKSLFQNIYEWGGMAGIEQKPDSPSVMDYLFYGLPAFLNTSLQSSASAPGADIVRDASMMFNVVALDRAKVAGQAIGNAFDHWRATGESPITSGAVRDGLVRAFGPRSLYRAMAVGQEGQLRSLMTGYPVAELKWNERLAYGMGLNPLVVEKTYRISDELWHKQNAMRDAVASYGKAWAEGVESGNTKILDEVTRLVLASGVDMSSVIRSANARLAKGREPLLERQFDEKISATIRSSVLGR